MNGLPRALAGAAPATVLALAGFSACGPAHAQERLLCTVALPSARRPVLPADTFDDLCAGLGRCWQPPQALADRARLEVTVLIRPGREGAIFGEPRPTFTAGVSTQEDRESLFRATIEAIRRCPAPMTPALAGRIAGHRTFLRIIYKKPQTEAR